MAKSLKERYGHIKMMCIATMRNMTAAMKGKDALSRMGIYCSVVNLEPSLTKGGCAYGVSFPCAYMKDVKRILSKKNIEYGEILGDSGGY